MHSKLIGEIESQEIEEQTVAKYHGLLEKWVEIDTSERQGILAAYMALHISKAIGISPSDINMQQSIKYLGIDSLIAVKLRNKVRTDWLVDLAAVKFLDDFTVVNLVMLVDEQINNAREQDRESLNPKAINDDDWIDGEI
ncbi:MAG: acyl carrier protein [Richelia sp. RM2_1_2]|nr:acyl carrier protein [Richelia sp. SM2_1_7]NJM21953.1 acyl carrier protein [Richelia sp. SM1_7_0]NJN09352.1 acyl carrier protein [Richelia sp. RM1_1_1]NJO59199.1 acyl carrier protein [Richelia sp. RM2_1_2]